MSLEISWPLTIRKGRIKNNLRGPRRPLPHHIVTFTFNATAFMSPQPLGLAAFVTSVQARVCILTKALCAMNYPLLTDTNSKHFQAPYRHDRGDNEELSWECDLINSKFNFDVVNLGMEQWEIGRVLHVKILTLQSRHCAHGFEPSENQDDMKVINPRRSRIVYLRSSHIAVREMQASAVVLRRHGLPCTLMQD